MKYAVIAVVCLSTFAAAQTCGFPGYKCARYDADTVVIHSMTVVPPDAGANHCSKGANGHLQSCGNVNGINTQIVEPNYNNAQIVRITDYEDIKAGCIPVAGLGGAASHNVFSSDSQYFLIGCTGGTTRVKWFNPSTLRVNVLPNDPTGDVLTTAGKVWDAPEQSRFAYSTPDAILTLTGTQVLSYRITAGIVSDFPALVADYSGAVPCWSSACPDWAAGSYAAGANITPLQNNITPAHSFQLINGPCATGATYPNFLPATAEAPGIGSQYVLTDGTCQWADMWAPPTEVGGKITWAASLTFSRDDKVISAALSNHKGQDASGACYLVEYNATTNTYSHLNTCTGNVYNNLAYAGNVYDANTFPAGRHNRVVLHSGVAFSSGTYSTLGFNNCALEDLTGAPLYCEAAAPGAEAASFNVFFWQFGTTNMPNSKDWLGTGTPGHAFPGFNIFGYSDQLDSVPNLYQGRALGSSGPSIPYWDISKDICVPNACIKNGLRQFGFDQHGSWVSNPGSDKTPICQASYGASGGVGSALWPAQFPWLGEVECMDTDGSNRVSRQAFTYDSQTSKYFNPQFQIGSLSSDGKFWIMSTDWFCTLGSLDGGTTNTCGLPYQANHDYWAVGELLGPIQYYAGVPGHIYKVVKPGTTDSMPLPSTYWNGCVTVGCTLTEGTAVFEYVGQNDAQIGVFLVKLQ